MPLPETFYEAVITRVKTHDKIVELRKMVSQLVKERNDMDKEILETLSATGDSFVNIKGHGRLEKHIAPNGDGSLRWIPNSHNIQPIENVSTEQVISELKEGNGYDKDDVTISVVQPTNTNVKWVMVIDDSDNTKEKGKINISI